MGRDGSPTYIVQVDVDAAKVQHQEISQRIDALDGEFVAIICFEEPGVVGLDEIERGLECPKLVGGVSVVSVTPELGTIRREKFLLCTRNQDCI